MQEDRIQYYPRGRVQAEGDVGEPEGGLHVGIAPLQLPDGLDRLDAVAPSLLLSGRDGEGEAVEHDVALAQAPLLGQVGDQPGGDAHLPLGRTSLRSEEHTSELQSRQYLVCRLLLEKKK